MNWSIKQQTLFAQLCDSAFPIGAFSFSNGLESAIENGYICHIDDLKRFTQVILHNSLHSDILAALIAFNALENNNYPLICDCDTQSYINKIALESRLMTTKMGKKCAEMTTLLFPDDLCARKWLEEIESGKNYGCYNISTAILFHAGKMPQEALFSALVYGVVNSTLNAALRVFRISHLETQKLLQEISSSASEAFPLIKELDLQDMQGFAPECDIIASLHEHGNKRMFAN